MEHMHVCTFSQEASKDINVLPNTTCLGGIKMFKVVICDDERIIRQGLKQMIPWKEYHFTTIYTATDGVEALSLIRQHQPELVITDIRMPRKMVLTY